MPKKLLVSVLAAAAIIGLIIFFVRSRGHHLSAGVQSASGSVESADSLLSRAQDAEARGELQEAKGIYEKLVENFPGANLKEVTAWQKKAEDLNIRLLFSPIITPNSVLYEIKPGDSLNKIAKNFKTTSELIMESNNLKDTKIVPGRKLKVWTLPFTIVVDKSQNTLWLKVNEEVIKTYTVSTGKNNCSPVGVFKIVNKLPNPAWFKAGAVVPANSSENILGSRWMGFDIPGYGIHGTTDPKSLGTQATAGCVRMSNAEVEELYKIIPVGTEVTIVD